MKKQSEFMEFTYGEGEQPVSVNIAHIANMGSLAKFNEHPTSASLFGGYGEGSRAQRMEALYNAVMEKNASMQPAPAPADNPPAETKKK